MLTREDYQDLDERYMKIADCTETQKSVAKKFANDDKRIDIIIHDFNAIKWLVGVVATATVGQLAVIVFSRLMGG